MRRKHADLQGLDERYASREGLRALEERLVAVSATVDDVVRERSLDDARDSALDDAHHASREEVVALRDRTSALEREVRELRRMLTETVLSLELSMEQENLLRQAVDGLGGEGR